MYSLYEALTKYTSNDTNFIFHSEDDWLFYKSGFIEQSLMIYNHSNYEAVKRDGLRFKKVSVLGLRSPQYYPPKLDLREFCGGPIWHINGEQRLKFTEKNRFEFIDKVNGKKIVYWIAQKLDCYAHWSANPGVKHKDLMIKAMEICWNKVGKIGVGSFERCIGCQYMKFFGYAQAWRIDNGFVGHLGHSGRHVQFKNVIETDGTISNETKINLNELNKIIKMDDGWYLNQSICKYIPPHNFTIPSDYNNAF